MRDVILNEVTQLWMSLDVHSLAMLDELGLKLIASFLSSLTVLS